MDTELESSVLIIEQFALQVVTTIYDTKLYNNHRCAQLIIVLSRT